MQVDILMAVYNSEKFLKPQLDSIFNQTFTDFRLIIRDDNSKDSTLTIIDEYEKKYPNKVILHKADKNMGAKANFNELLKLSTADYIMFCDHDDIWLDDKIQLTFTKMKELEKNTDHDTPLLIFTDKSIVDENLNIIHKSSVKAEKFDVRRLIPSRLLVQNVASGCSIMINKPLLNLCGSIPSKAVMHDHYLMVLAAFFGKIAYVNKPTMLYRQHSHNEIGAKAAGIKYFIQKLKENPKTIKKRFIENVIQGQIIMEKYGNKLNDKDGKTLESFVKLKDAKRCEFISLIITNGFYKSGLSRKIGMIALIL